MLRRELEQAGFGGLIQRLFGLLHAPLQGSERAAVDIAFMLDGAGAGHPADAGLRIIGFNQQNAGALVAQRRALRHQHIITAFNHGKHGIVDFGRFIMRHGQKRAGGVLMQP